MAGLRWGRALHLLVWAALTAVQGWLLTLDVGIELKVAGLVGVQLGKALAAVPRVRDLARPLDDAIYALVPLLNVALFFQLLRPAPPPARWARRMEVVVSQPLAVGSYAKALGLMASTWKPTLAAVVVVSVGMQLGEWAFLDAALRALPRLGSALGSLSEGLLVAIVALGLYTLIQLKNRHKASHLSWLPSLGLVPALLVYGSLRVVALEDASSRLFGLIFLQGAFRMLVAPLLAALVALLVVGGLAALRDGADPAVALSRIRGRYARVAAPLGLRALLVELGLQVIVPGVWFAVSYAFADILAVLHPDRPTLRSSGDLVRGARSSVFKLLLLWVFANVGTSLGIVAVAVGAASAPAALFDPTQLPFGVVFVSAWVSGLLYCWSLTALFVFYEAREARVAFIERAQAQPIAPAQGG